MWPFKKSGGDFSVRAQTASSVLIGVTNVAAPHLLKELVEGERTDQNQEMLVPITYELLIFGLHLTDRIAFGRLGVSNRSDFMNALLQAIKRELQPPFNLQLMQLYNTRNTFYGGFRKLYPDEKDNLKDTLFWEFGKALCSVYADSNPMTIVKAAMFGMTFMREIRESFEKTKVFS